MKSGANVITNDVFHHFIDRLAADKISGEVTLYFSKGIIESSRTSERLLKTDIREKIRIARTARKNKSLLSPTDI